MRIVALAIAAYLIGSLPSAFVVVRLSRGTDLRAVESGSVGALNAFRATGAGWVGVGVLLADATDDLERRAPCRGDHRRPRRNSA
jgi:glycerol-3-phosphate acyltransferase PlsY